mgnify:CR=1 FL=1
MAKSKKAPKKKSTLKAAKPKAGTPPSPALPGRGPWSRSWKVLWGFLSVVGELTLIFLVKSQLVGIPTVQLVVIAICIPIVAHLIISGLRQFLILISPR